MESAEGQRGRERRSPLDVIMSQIRRKRTASDRKPLGRFLSRTPSQKMEIPGDGECPGAEDRGQSSAVEEDGGWGSVCVFLQRLGVQADSRRLSLSHCDLSSTELLELATLLRFLPRLEELDVSWNELIGGSLAALTSHLRHVGGATALRLCSCRLNAEDAAALGDALAGVPLLEILDLSWNSGMGGEALQGMLGKLQPPLRELHLVNCQLTAADASALGGVLPFLPRLCVLDVSCNPQLTQEVDGGGGFMDLAAALSHASSLSTLRLQACGLTPSSLDALGGALRCLPCIRELDLSQNRCVSGGLSRLTFHLAHLTRLESLDLHLCCLTQADLEALIQVLCSLTALAVLDVSSNQEAGGVVQPLVSALPLTQMKRLPLNNCSLSEESIAALALAVPYLHSVDVSWCKALGGRAAPLLDALQPSILAQLRLSSCDLSTGDLRHLAAVSAGGRLSSLRALDLSYNGSVEDAGWAALFDAGGLGSLEELDLSLRPLTSARPAAWLPALLRALPRLPALSRVAARRWTAASRDRRQLSLCVRKRSVLLEFDPDAKDAQPTNQESPEE